MNNNYYYDSTDDNNYYGDNPIWPPEDVVEKKITAACREACKQLGALKFGEEYSKRFIVKELAKRLAPYYTPKYKMAARIKAELRGKVSERTIEKVLAELGDEYVDPEMRRRGKMAAEANKIRGLKEAEEAVTTAATIQKEMFTPVRDAMDAAEDSVIIVMKNGKVVEVNSDKDYESGQEEKEEIAKARVVDSPATRPAAGAATTAAEGKPATTTAKDAENQQQPPAAPGSKSKPIALSSSNGSTSLLWSKSKGDTLDDFWSQPDPKDGPE